MLMNHSLKPVAQRCVHVSARRSVVWLNLGLALLVAPLFLAEQPLRSQQATGAQAQAPPITVHVKVVNVLATVRDKKGAIVRNLSQNDFELKEDDRPQTIRYFSHETDLPLTLGLLVDTSMSQRRVLGQERDAAGTFLDQVLRVDKDQAFVIHFDHEVELLQDLTSSRQKLQAALGLLQVPQRSEEDRGDSPDSGQGQGGGGRGGGRGRGGFGGGGTTLYDAIYLASNDLMAKQGGRKALIVLSDGVDRNSKKTLASAIEAAQRADTLVYSILFSSEEQGSGGGGGGYGHHGMGGGMGGGGHHGGGYPRPQQSRPDGKKILERLSKETGGRFSEVSKKHPIDETFSQIQEELRNQYSLGYTPDPPNTGPGYHKITLTTKKSDLIVQARDGYYSESSR